MGGLLPRRHQNPALRAGTWMPCRASGCWVLWARPHKGARVQCVIEARRRQLSDRGMISNKTQELDFGLDTCILTASQASNIIAKQRVDRTVRGEHLNTRHTPGDANLAQRYLCFQYATEETSSCMEERYSLAWIVPSSGHQQREARSAAPADRSRQPYDGGFSSPGSTPSARR